MRSLIPLWLYGLLAWIGRRGPERSLNCRFPSVEAAVARLAPRPWLMIHGERDTYIGPEIARSTLRSRQESQGAVAGSGGQAQSLPRNRSGRLRRAGCWVSSNNSPRAARVDRGGASRVARRSGLASDFAPSAGRRRRSREKWRLPSRADRSESGRRPAMIKMLMRLIGAPVVKRSRRLARAFLDQTRSAGDVQRDLLLAPARPARRQPVRPRPLLARDPHAGRLSPPRADQRLRSARAVHRSRAPGRHRALFRPGHRSPHVRDDLGHDQPAQDDPGHARGTRRLPRRAGRSGGSWRSTPIAR